ncbi:MAG: helix-turn-helix domain-containing protein [Coriobacteriaceae bacterium]|nr:helix-turn-helix domain-containing protein [Coriobacteriaceae bacterium]
MTQHFGDIMLERRRQMGLSLSQVASAIKIRPQIIEYIETENFQAMPPRGYAQGIISSYAKFLGLDSRMMVEAYFKASDEFQNSSEGGRVGRFQDAAADALPRSSNASGRYYLVNNVPVSRFAQRPQQAGYVSEGSSYYEPRPSDRVRTAAVANGRSNEGYDASLRSRSGGRGGNAGARGQRRSQNPSERRDPSYGRRPADGSRRQRPVSRDPQGRRQEYRDPRNRDRSNQAPRRGSASSNAPMSPFDPKVLLALIAFLALLVIVLGFFALRGCMPAEQPADNSKPAAAEVDKKSDEKSADDDSEAEDESSADDSEGEKDKDEKDKEKDKVPEKTVVVVSVKEKGAVAWLEVKLDGKSVIGKEVLGPFKQEFTVERQIDITTNKPADVQITKNGEKVSYDTRVSGVAKVSIFAPKKEEDDTKVVDSDGDGTPDMTAEEAEKAGLPIPDPQVDEPDAGSTPVTQ